MKISPHVAIVARKADDTGLSPEQGWLRQDIPVGVRAWRDDHADVVSAIWQRLRPSGAGR